MTVSARAPGATARLDPAALLQVHTCAIYAIAGWARVEDLGWLRGHAVFNAMTNSMLSRWLIDWQPFKPVLSAMTWITYGLEPLAPIALWIPRLRVVWATCCSPCTWGWRC